MRQCTEESASSTNLPIILIVQNHVVRAMHQLPTRNMREPEYRSHCWQTQETSPCMIPCRNLCNSKLSCTIHGCNSGACLEAQSHLTPTHLCMGGSSLWLLIMPHAFTTKATHHHAPGEGVQCTKPHHHAQSHIIMHQGRVSSARSYSNTTHNTHLALWP